MTLTKKNAARVGPRGASKKSKLGWGGGASHAPRTNRLVAASGARLSNLGASCEDAKITMFMRIKARS